MNRTKIKNKTKTMDSQDQEDNYEVELQKLRKIINNNLGDVEEMTKTYIEEVNKVWTRYLTTQKKLMEGYLTSLKDNSEVKRKSTMYSKSVKGVSTMYQTAQTQLTKNYLAAVNVQLCMVMGVNLKESIIEYDNILRDI